jgi:DNA-binding transcriptional LysR family regulator
MEAAAPVESLASAMQLRAAAFPPARVADPRGGLRVGFAASLSRGPLRNLLRIVSQRPEGPRLSFLEGGRTDVLQAARRGEVDIGFVSGPEDWTRLRGEELWRDRLMVAMAEDHPLARHNSVRGEELQRQTFLAPGSAGERRSQLALVERAIGGEPAGFVCVPAERESVFHLVGLGFGVALACGSAMGTLYPGVVYRTIASPWTVLPFYAVWRSGQACPELGPFLTAARDAARDWTKPQ